MTADEIDDQRLKWTQEELARVLLPCPFCGAEAHATRTVNGTQMFYVRCPCGIEMKAAWYRDQPNPTKDIIAAWNHRPSAPADGAGPQEKHEIRKDASPEIDGAVPDVQDATGNRHRTFRGDGAVLPEVSEEREVAADSTGKGRLRTPEIAAADGAGSAPPPELDGIPEFIEPRFWVKRTAYDWGIHYRQHGRELCIGVSSETIARVRCKILNEIVYEEIQTHAAQSTKRPTA